MVLPFNTYSEFIAVIIYAKFVPLSIRQQCHWNYCNISYDKGLVVLQVPIFVVFIDNL